MPNPMNVAADSCVQTPRTRAPHSSKVIYAVQTLPELRSAASAKLTYCPNLPETQTEVRWVILKTNFEVSGLVFQLY